MRAVTIFYKKGTKLLKTFSAKIEHAASSGTSPGTPMHFCLLPRIMDVKQQKNKSQFVKNELHSPTCPPRKKMGIFAKMTNIVHSINIRTVSLFCKIVQNVQKTFSAKYDQFSTSENMLYTHHHFCTLVLCIDDLQQKSNRKWVTYCPNFSPGDLRGNSYFFRKLYINIKHQGK